MWSEYSSCSKTCGQGEYSRTRECVDRICSKVTSNDMIETKPRMDKECTVLSTGSDWNSCSVTCGPGEQTRSRTCDQGCDDVPNQPADSNKCNMTIEYRKAWCNNRGYKIASVQYYWQCFCGNTLSPKTKIWQSKCNAPCRGNNSQMCGGSMAMNIYYL